MRLQIRAQASTHVCARVQICGSVQRHRCTVCARTHTYVAVRQRGLVLQVHTNLMTHTHASGGCLRKHAFFSARANTRAKRRACPCVRPCMCARAHACVLAQRVPAIMRPSSTDSAFLHHACAQDCAGAQHAHMRRARGIVRKPGFSAGYLEDRPGYKWLVNLVSV